MEKMNIPKWFEENEFEMHMTETFKHVAIFSRKKPCYFCLRKT